MPKRSASSLAHQFTPPPAAISRRAWLRRSGVFAASVLGTSSARADDDAALAGATMPYDAFDRLASERVEVGGGVIRVAFGPGAFELPRARLLDYVRQCAVSVATYYGRFPAHDTRLLVLPTQRPGRPVRSGTAFGYRGAAIKLTLAESVTPDDLERDWILVHEMTHLALPSMPRRQHWIEEGIASYVEPLARAQAGVLAPQKVWTDMIEGMPRGLPQAGDRGLDHTPTWGRTYWGGALFCLLADVQIRERSGNAKGLQHALRAILAAGNMETASNLDRVLPIGDAAIGMPVLAGLYARMKDEPYPVDLDALWRRLGVAPVGRGVSFDEQAPLAAVRRALTALFTA